MARVSGQAAADAQQGSETPVCPPLADAVLLAPGGPVDAVLNSLTSAGMVAASLAGLKQVLVWWK